MTPFDIQRRKVPETVLIMSEQVLFKYLRVFDVNPSNGKAFARKQLTEKRITPNAFANTMFIEISSGAGFA